MAKYKIYYTEAGVDKTEEYTSSTNIKGIHEEFGKDINRIDILEDPDNINTDEAFGYPKTKGDE